LHTTKAELKTYETLKNRADFLNVQKNGKRWSARGLTLMALPNELGVTRAGFTVTKRLEKSAVSRNRMKRRLRAAAADTLTNHAAGSTDYVLFARPMTATRPYDKLCGDIKWCLEKLGYLRE